jgi:acyl-CoA thioesterase FadM
MRIFLRAFRHRMYEQQFVLEVFEVVVVNVKPSLQRPIRHPPLALEQIEDWGEDVIEDHGEPSAELAVK